jgi:hypothetical protein
MVRDVTVPTLSGLVVIARSASGKIITRITSHRDLVGAMHTARCVLKLRPDAVHVEVHHAESSTSDYRNPPLAAMSQEDLPMEQIR